MGPTEKPLVAFVDDQEDLAHSLAAKYSAEYETYAFTSPHQALSRIDASFAAVIADHRMPGMTGVDLLAKLRIKTPHTVRVLLTAVADLIPLLTLINEAQVFHYVPKDPLSLDHLRVVIANAVEFYCLRQEKEQKFHHLQQRSAQLQALVRMQTSDERSFEDILGNDPQLQAALNKARWAANNDMTVLITGESGTGKEDLARAIHFQGRRKRNPFKKENCSMFQRELMQAALFGKVQGAFTGAITSKGILREADGGTVFLDEIGELDLELQAFLLAFLDGGDIHPVGYSGQKSLKADVRIVTATNRNLSSAVNDGKFRLDLFHRINEVAIHLPALRDRRGDIPTLAKRAVIVASHKLGLEGASIGASVIEQLQSLPYPGNVRELFNLIKQAMATMQMDGRTTIELDYVRAATELQGTMPFASGSLEEAVEAFKKQYIEAVLKRHQTRRAAGEELGVDVRTLFNYLKKPEA
jgi:DNA-binding NtrC family response regulator